MAHKHPVYDSDTHFKIDGLTRIVKNVSETKTMLVQFDHHSERFTFEVPRFVDEHDLSLCNLVRVHYINVDKTKRTENKGICEITDLQISPDDSELVVCSWLVSDNATQLVGALYFVIQFACVEAGEVVYSWNTARHTAVSVIDGIDNGGAMEEKHEDTLLKWEKMLLDGQISDLKQTKISTEDNGENIWTATLANGKKEHFSVRNGSTGLVGSIRTVDGERLDFFAGKRAKYDSLPAREQETLLAFITDESDEDFEFTYSNTTYLPDGTWATGGTYLALTEGKTYLFVNTTLGLTFYLYVNEVTNRSYSTMCTDSEIQYYLCYYKSSARDGVPYIKLWSNAGLVEGSHPAEGSHFIYKEI